ncbi:MAG: hypothetical protein H6883_07295 [Rhodobiaceae bacterium]|nr:hypothetical protein [Rhodobiaceae bacterium]MCC0055925.1 hypothetical protein [Rhodobiaceae bacterium]
MFGFSTIKLIAIGIVVAGVAGSILYYGHTRYRAGWDDAIATVSKMNNEAAAVARKAQSTVDECFDSGGTWNVSTGKCDR